MGNVLIVMWRESLEAMLVVTILAGVLQRMGVANGKRYLWIGVSAGIILSVALALGLQQLQARLPENAYDKFQAFLLLLAVALVTHMVIWMQRHGRKMKQELESDTHAALARTGLWGIGLVAAFAIAREGVETVVFLYGLALGNHLSALALATSAAGGLLLALATTWLIGRGMRGFSYRAFFQTTGFLLLLFATSMLVTAIGQLTQLDLVPAMIDPVWNSAWLLDEHSAIGGPIAALTGYRSHPSLIQILTIAAFWALALPLMYRTPSLTRKE
jgi:high-affinity iron transporter